MQVQNEDKISGLKTMLEDLKIIKETFQELGILAKDKEEILEG